MSWRVIAPVTALIRILCSVLPLRISTRYSARLLSASRVQIR